MNVSVSAQSASIATRSHQRADIQGLRAVAVLSVFVNHLWDWPSGGFVGVDVFFVISGYLITGLLLRERDRQGEIDFASFYKRRARRILPAAILVLLVTAAVGYLVFPITRAKSNLIDALYASVFASNWRFEAVGTDYFSQGTLPSAVRHFWSLSIEEQFYFVWPALLLLLFVATRRRPIYGHPVLRTFVLGGVMAVICVASFGWAMVQTSDSPTSAYFSSFARVWELGIGALMAISGPALRRIPVAAGVAMSWIGLLGIFVSLFLIGPDSEFPGPTAALPVLSAALVVAAFHDSRAICAPLLTNPIAKVAGDASYSLYLWHWPVIVLLAAVMEKSVAYYVIVVFLSFGLAFASYYLYERPIHHSRWLDRTTTIGSVKINPKVSMAVGVVAVFVVALSLGSFAMQNEQQAQRPDTLTVAAAAEVSERCVGASAITTKGCSIADADKGLTPSIDRLGNDTQGAYSCWREDGATSFPPCTFGSTEPTALKVALVGDSHAAALLPALAERVIGLNWSLTPMVGNNCRWRGNLTGECSEAIRALQSRLQSQRPYDLVITTSARKYGDPSEVAAFEATWRRVANQGIKVVVVTDNPQMPESILSCVTRFGASAADVNDCGTTKSVGFAKVDTLASAGRLTPGVEVVETSDLFCTPDGRCPAVIGGDIVYRDANGHVTGTYMKTMAQTLTDRISKAIS